MAKKITTSPSGISLDGQKLNVKNKSKFKANNNISFDEKGNIVNLTLDKINVDTTSSKIPIQGNIPTVKSSPLGITNYALDTAANFIPSTKQLLYDYAQPFLHPIDTYNGVKSMITGFNELRDRSKFIKNNPNVEPPPLTENMIMAEAVNEHFANRYGDWVGKETDDWDVIGRKFADTFRKDPAGVLADVSGVLSLGTIGMARYAGKAGGIVQKVAQNIDPLQGTLSATGKLTTNIAGPLTGKGTGLLNAAFDSGASGETIFRMPTKDNLSPVTLKNSSASDSFNLARKGKLTPSQMINDYIEKVNKLKSTASEQYSSWIEGLPSDYIQDLKTPALILKEIQEIKYGKTGKQKRPIYNQKTEPVDIPTEIINPKTGKPFTKAGTKTTNTKRGSDADVTELNALENEILNYANNDSLHNAQALAQLKLKLGKMKFKNPEIQKIQTKINNSIKNDLGLVDKNTSNVMSNYETMLNNLDDLKMAIGDPTKNNFNPQTAINKAQSILKDNPRGNLGFDKANPILKKIESELIPSLAGSGLTNMAGPNTKNLVFGAVIGGGGDSLFSQMPQFGGTGEFVRNASLGLLPLSSPNLMGNIYNKMGLLSKYGVNTNNAGLLSRKVLNPLTSTTEAPFGEGLTDLDIQNLMRTSKTSETTPVGTGINNLLDYLN